MQIGGNLQENFLPFLEHSRHPFCGRSVVMPLRPSIMATGAGILVAVPLVVGAALAIAALRLPLAAAWAGLTLFALARAAEVLLPV
jgi:hypothetical protein